MQKFSTENFLVLGDYSPADIQNTSSDIPIRATIVCDNRILGKMPERSNGQPWKGCISERVSRVRIPLFPPRSARAVADRPMRSVENGGR